MVPLRRSLRLYGEHTTNNAGNSEDASVDHVADGELKVELHDLGISSEDIQAMRRIEARLAERSRNAR